MEITARLVEKTIKVPVITFNGTEIPVDPDGTFDTLIEELCACDGFFAIRGISDDPTVAAMIKADLVLHGQSRGCYGTDLLRKHKDKILEVYYKLWE